MAVPLDRCQKETGISEACSNVKKKRGGENALKGRRRTSSKGNANEGGGGGGWGWGGGGGGGGGVGGLVVFNTGWEEIGVKDGFEGV